MKGKMIIAAIIAVSIAIAPNAIAKDKKASKPKDQRTIGLTHQQFMSILAMITEARAPQQTSSQPGTPGQPGARGETGAAGRDGTPGERGQAGRDGEAGAAGKDGEPGRDGKDGRDGVGFTPGTIFLVNGACPPGTTIQGPQNRWTVYANDTSGRPWTTTGSSAQLFLSACQVN